MNEQELKAGLDMLGQLFTPPKPTRLQRLSKTLSTVLGIGLVLLVMSVVALGIVAVIHLIVSLV